MNYKSDRQSFEFTSTEVFGSSYFGSGRSETSLDQSIYESENWIGVLSDVVGKILGVRFSDQGIRNRSDWRTFLISTLERARIRSFSIPPFRKNRVGILSDPHTDL